MLSRVFSTAVFGIDAYAVEVEVDIGNGLPAFNIVGLPDTACRESADRVRAAIKNSDLPFSTKKITVNLAPADLKKEGPSSTKLSPPTLPIKTLVYRSCLTKGRSEFYKIFNQPRLVLSHPS